MPSSGTEAPARQAWAAFVAWALVGAGLSLGTLSILSIGMFVLVATAVVACLVALWRRSMAEAFGAVSGLALPLFYVGYLNRSGPGEICSTNVGGTSCTDEWSPWPFIMVGVLLMLAGVIAFLMFRRHVVRRLSLNEAG